MADKLKNPVLWACLAGFVMTVGIFFPGFMNFDAAFQLYTFRLGEMSNWHPPLSGWLWGHLESLFPGPFAVLLITAGLFWLAVGLTFATWPRWPVAGAVLLVGMSPPVSSMVGTILKDTLMAAALLAGAGLLATSWRTGRATWAWLALAPFFLAAGVRHNGAAALLPLLTWWAWLVFPGRAGWIKATVAATAVGVLYLMSSLLNDGLKVIEIYPAQQILLHDLVALSIDQNRVMLPRYVEQFPEEPEDVPFEVEDLRGMYVTWDTSPLFTLILPEQEKSLSYARTAEHYSELTAKWREVVPHYPLSYLEHRAKLFAHLLGLNPGPVCIPFAYDHKGYNNPQVGIAYETSAAYRAAAPLFQAAGNSPLFRPVLYAAGAAILFLLAWWRRPTTTVPVLALSGSALSYLLPYTLLTTTCAYRMSFWTVVATLAAGGLYWCGRKERGSED